MPYPGSRAPHRGRAGPGPRVWPLPRSSPAPSKQGSCGRTGQNCWSLPCQALKRLACLVLLPPESAARDRRTTGCCSSRSASKPQLPHNEPPPPTPCRAAGNPPPPMAHPTAQHPPRETRIGATWLSRCLPTVIGMQLHQSDGAAPLLCSSSALFKRSVDGHHQPLCPFSPPVARQQ